jgi:hypothetical protein
MTDDEIKKHINNLDVQSKQNLKTLAEAANSEEHDSFKAVAKWAAGLIGGPATVGIV